VGIVNKYNSELRRLSYSSNTMDIYTCYFKEFVKHFSGRDYRYIKYQEIIDYINSIDNLSDSKQNQIINSIKFYFEKMLGQKRKFYTLKRPRQSKKLPKVIETDVIVESLSKIKNIKHKAILSLAFSCGIRVSEVCDLKIKNIDSNRMLIFIESGKGNKDRYVPLSENILKLLREYFILYKPKEYLFNGKSKNHLRYSCSSCREIFKKYIKSKDKTFHSLRHSCFTYLLENGENLRTIQSIAGHSSSKTTEIYTHVSKKLLNKVKLPI